MNEIMRQRDSVITIVGLAALVVAFLLILYFPNTKSAQMASTEIAQTEQSIREIPIRLAERKMLESKIQERREYIEATLASANHRTDVHEIVSHVAQLAEASQLSVKRIEPLAVVEHESYKLLPFQVSFLGEFDRAFDFLHAMEREHRFFLADELSIQSHNEGNRKQVEIDLKFSIRVITSDFSDFDRGRAAHTADI